jgi:hypothetical protein
VTIAIEPYVTDDQAKTVFGKVNPWRYGVLPVLIVMRNDGPDTVRLDKAKFIYELPDRSKVEATPAEDLKFLKGPSQPSVSKGQIPIPIRISKGGPKGPLAGWEIEGRAFVPKLLPPGDSASGFVYFQTGALSDAASVYVSGLVNARTAQELFYFEIPVSGQ